MKHSQRLAWYAVLAAVGVIAIVLGVIGAIDELFSWCGAVLLAIAALKLVKEVRYARDPSYARKIAVNESDERLAFVASKSAEASFQVSVVALAVLSLALRPFGLDDAANVLAVVMGAEVAVFWVSYLVASKKY